MEIKETSPEPLYENKCEVPFKKAIILLAKLFIYCEELLNKVYQNKKRVSSILPLLEMSLLLMESWSVC